MKKRVMALASISLAGLGLVARFGAPAKTAACAAELTSAELVESLQLGAGYLLRHQQPAGRFDYEYDWRAKTLAADDNQVRQAGAVWGLALLAAAPPAVGLPAAELRAAAWKGVRFFDAHAADTAAGARYPIYVSATDKGAAGSLGTVALVALALVDLLRQPTPELAADERGLWVHKLDAYLLFLLEARNADGLFHGQYDYASGRAMAEHSPYADGEALLALAKAAKYLRRDDLKDAVLAAARAGYAHNVEEALAADADSDVTKGYYQWSSMAFAELADSPWAGEAPFGDWLLRLADWMVDVHETLGRPRNTGYAYEGLVPAYVWAEAHGDARAAKLRCVLAEGLGKLLGWQVGHPRAAALGPADAAGKGGIQNHAAEPGLRIDVAQHQLHGTLMAWEALYGVSARKP